MKKIIIFQIFLLIIGKCFISGVSVKLPVGGLWPFFSKNFSAKEVHWIKGKLILKNITVKTDLGPILCPQANVLQCFPDVLLQFKDASLQCSQANISNAQGLLCKRGHSYRAIITANSSSISKINFVCDSISLKGNNAFRLPENVFLLPAFSLQQLDIHLIKQNHAFIGLQGLKAKDIYIEKLLINSSNEGNNFNINTFKYKNIIAKNLFGCFQIQKDLNELTLNDVIFYSNADYNNIKNISISCNAQKISKETFCSKIYAENEAFNVDIKANNFLKFDIRSSHGYIRETFVNELFSGENLPIDLKTKNNLYFSVHGLKSNFNVSFSTKNIFLEEECLSSVQGHASVENLNNISWDANLHAENTNPKLSGQYDLSQRRGWLLGCGYIKPNLTYQLKEYLPGWWYSFFQNFRCNEKYPYADFQISFDLNNSTATTFGNSYVHDCEYKNTHIDDLNVSFGNQPGFCQLTINTLKADQNQQGQFQIDWPYDKINPDLELWIFKGQGNFPVGKWQNLLENFIGHNNNFDAFKFFTTQSIANVQFNGRISHQKDPEEYLNLYFNIPQTDFFAIPVKRLQFDYRWTQQKTSINNIKGDFWNHSPVVAKVDLTGKAFSFSFKGQKLNSSKILRHHFFKPWRESIPEENLKMYDGIFDICSEGHGELLEELHLSGTGHIDFKNENLSQIHLLGPLSKLFSKRFKWQPQISFNQFVSDFTFTERSISSNESVLLGPSTRADIHGDLNLHKQAITAQIHFSFLDYNQMQFPIMKHVVQIFQPLSKGFSASVSGTFKNPQWFLTFNPFRFVFKRK